MVKLIIKNSDGTVEVKELTKGMTFKPKSGQQFYFDNLDSKKYTFSSNNEETINLTFDNNAQKYTFNFEFKEKEHSEKPILGIINDQKGMDELNQTVLKPEFKSDNIINDLKALLEQSSIVDFSTLAKQLNEKEMKSNTSINKINLEDSITDTQETNTNNNNTSTRGREVGANELTNNLLSIEDTDLNNTIKVILNATKVVNINEKDITYIVNLLDSDGKTVLVKEDVFVTLENGETITIKAGQAQGSTVTTISQSDVTSENYSITNSIKNVTSQANIEDFQIDDTVVTTTIINNVNTVEENNFEGLDMILRSSVNLRANKDLISDEDVDLSNVKTNTEHKKSIDLTNDYIDELIVEEQNIKEISDNEKILKIFNDSVQEDSTKNISNSDTQKVATNSSATNVKTLIDDDICVNPDI